MGQSHGSGANADLDPDQIGARWCFGTGPSRGGAEGDDPLRLDLGSMGQNKVRLDQLSHRTEVRLSRA